MIALQCSTESPHRVRKQEMRLRLPAPRASLFAYGNHPRMICFCLCFRPLPLPIALRLGKSQDQTSSTNIIVFLKIDCSSPPLRHDGQSRRKPPHLLVSQDTGYALPSKASQCPMERKCRTRPSWLHSDLPLENLLSRDIHSIWPRAADNNCLSPSPDLIAFHLIPL